VAHLRTTVFFGFGFGFGFVYGDAGCAAEHEASGEEDGWHFRHVVPSVRRGEGVAATSAG
jgi:hypothetical protein